MSNEPTKLEVEPWRLPGNHPNRERAGINDAYEQRYRFHDAENYLYQAPKGLNREIVEKISEFKSEPEWMRDFRLKALDHFLARKQPTWGSPMLADLDYNNIRYFVRASETPSPRRIASAAATSPARSRRLSLARISRT